MTTRVRKHRSCLQHDRIEMKSDKRTSEADKLHAHLIRMSLYNTYNITFYLLATPQYS